MLNMKKIDFILVLVTAILLSIGFYADCGIPIEVNDDEPEPMVYKLIPLQSLEFSTVDKVCRPWLSEKGLMIYEKRRKSILVYERVRVIDRIRKFIDNLDAPVPNIKIEVDRHASGQKQADKFSYDYNKPVKVVHHKHGKKIWSKKTPSRLELYSRRNATHSTTSSFIVTQSGSPAQLWVGKTVVDPSWRRFQRPDKTVIINQNTTTVVVNPQEPAMVDVGISLQVVPRYLGNNMIEVEVFPEISEITGKRRNKAVKVTALSSKVVVKNGSRVSIGGVINQNREKYTNIFGPDFFKRNDINQVMNMYLTATVMTR